MLNCRDQEDQQTHEDHEENGSHLYYRILVWMRGWIFLLGLDSGGRQKEGSRKILFVAKFSHPAVIENIHIS